MSTSPLPLCPPIATCGLPQTAPGRGGVRVQRGVPRVLGTLHCLARKAGAGDAVPSEVSRGAPRAYSGRFEELLGSPGHSFSRASLWLARSPALWTERLKRKERLSFIGRGYVVLAWLIPLRLVSVSRIVFGSCLVAREETAGRKTSHSQRTTCTRHDWALLFETTKTKNFR